MDIRDDLVPTYLPEFTPIPTSPTTLDDGTPLPQVPKVPNPRDVFGTPSSPRPEVAADTDTRTPTSSGGKPRVGDPKHAAKIVSGLVGLAFVVGAGLLAQLRDRDLRRPNKRQSDGVSEPVARILARHTDLSAVTPDLADVIEAGAAVGDYLTDGPIVVRRREVDSLADDYFADPDPDPDPEPAPAPVVTYAA